MKKANSDLYTFHLKVLKKKKFESLCVLGLSGTASMCSMNAGQGGRRPHCRPHEQLKPLPGDPRVAVPCSRVKLTAGFLISACAKRCSCGPGYKAVSE